jgi:hypothetical protein
MKGESQPTMNKDIPLEAIRGVAALVVVVWHVCYGFFPHIIGVYPQFAAQSLQGNPLFVFMNGPAAVALFFVHGHLRTTANAKKVGMAERRPQPLSDKLCIWTDRSELGEVVGAALRASNTSPASRACQDPS